MKTDEEELADILLRVAERFAPTPSPYIGRTADWTRDKLHEHVTVDQQSIMDSVDANRYTAVQSSHDTGKSYSASRIAAAWIDTHPSDEVFLISTAPTTHQVGAILWREIGRAHRKGNLKGRIVAGTNEWKIGYARKKQKGDTTAVDDELIGFGKKPSDYNAVALTGHHERYMLVIIDEACGVDQRIYEAVDAIATNKHARVLAIGNPDDPSSYFAKICQPGSGWNVIQIDGIRQPTFTAKAIKAYPRVQQYMIQQGVAPSKEPLPDELHDMLIDPGWVDERIKRWGIGSPMFISKVRGLFPKVSVDSLFHPHWVNLARSRETEPIPLFGRMGVDVARYGTDMSIIMLRQGGHCRVVHEVPYGPVTEVAGLVQVVGHGTSPQLPVACVDDTGVGGGVTDILEEEDYPVIPIIAGSASKQMLPNGKPRFFNLRAELMWNLKEALAGPSGTGEDGWLDLDPLDDELAAQLMNIKYKINRHGQIQVESKDDMKARGVDSPDRADALSYSLAPNTHRIKAKVRQGAMITSDIMSKQW